MQADAMDGAPWLRFLYRFSIAIVLLTVNKIDQRGWAISQRTVCDRICIRPCKIKVCMT
jgi:hypothetical protein